MNNASLSDQWRREGYWKDTPVSDYLTQGAARYPDAYTIFCSSGTQERVSNEERMADAIATQQALQSLGVKRGDVVAVQLTASRATASIYHACLNLGAIVLPIVTIYGEEEVSFILEQSSARVLFTHSVLRSSNYLARIPRYRAIGTLARIVVLDDEVPDGAMTWKAFMTAASQPVGAPAADLESVHGDDTCLIVYTSGTTSRPKGVMHTHNTLMAEWSRESFGIQGPHLCCFPMGHYTGFSFLMRPLISGTSSIFMDRWDAELAARLIEQYRITDCGGTPYFLLTLLDAAHRADIDISSLENFPMGGTGITDEHVRLAAAAGFVAGRVYGSTEHPTVTYTWGVMDFGERGSTDGKVEDGNQVRIVDQAMNDLPDGMEGEILTRGPELFVGYLDRSVDSEAFVEGGWFRTGDLGSLRNGCLTITGRMKDIIIRGGENISALEVEGYINEIPGIDEVAVIGAPDALLGEQVVAYVHATGDRHVDEASVIDSLHARGIAKQKIPIEVFFVKDFPRTPSGKIKKHELRESGADYVIQAEQYTD